MLNRQDRLAPRNGNSSDWLLCANSSHSRTDKVLGISFINLGQENVRMQV